MRGVQLAVAALAGAAVVATGGCVTEERVLPTGQNVRHVMEEDDEPKTPQVEQRLLADAEESPESPRVWWKLGEYYEGTSQLAAALNAYVRMQACIEAETAKTGRKYTAGDYHLGRVYTKGRDYLRAIHHLQAVLALQPQELAEASLNRHFRESHYLLGAIYYENKQWEPARKHFVSFRELGGEPERVEPWLAKIDEATWSGDARAGRGRLPKGGEPAPPPGVPAAPKGQ